MAIVTDVPPTVLPAHCENLRSDALRRFLTDLISFSRSYAIRIGCPHADEIQFFCPQYVISKTLDVSERTLRHWLSQPEVRTVVRHVAIKQDGWFHRLNAGTLFAVKLHPNGASEPKLRFERGTHFRDLRQDMADGRVAATYTPQTRDLQEALRAWVYPVSEEASQAQAPVNVPATPVSNPVEAVQDAFLMRTAGHVQRAGAAIVQALGDDPCYLRAWYRLLWRLVRSADTTARQLFTATLDRFRTAHQEGLRSAGAQLLREAAVAGWR